MADLGRGRAGPDELTRGCLQGHTGPELGGEEFRLVESPSPLSLWMKGHGHGPRSGQAFHHQPLDQQESQRRGQATPALVLEPLDRELDRSLVGDRGSKARKRAEALPAPAVAASRLDLCPTPAAQRLVEAPDASTTAVAEPGADTPAAAAARRQDQVDEPREHAPRLPARVKPAFTRRQLMWISSPRCRSSSAVEPGGSSSTLRAPQTNHTTPYHGGSFA